MQKRQELPTMSVQFMAKTATMEQARILRFTVFRKSIIWIYSLGTKFFWSVDRYLQTAIYICLDRAEVQRRRL